MKTSFFSALVAALLVGTLFASPAFSQDTKDPEEQPQKDDPPKKGEPSEDDGLRGEKNPMGPADIGELEPIGGGNSEINYPSGPIVPGK